MGLDLEVSASITLGDLNEALDNYGHKHHKAEPKPFYMSRTSSSIPTAAGIVILDLQAPPTGSIWQIRSITTFGTDAFTQVKDSGGTNPLFGALFVGDSLNLNLAGLKITGLQYPSTTYVPDTVMWCHPNENLVFQVGYSGGLVPAGQQVGVNIAVEEWRECDVSRMNGA